MPVDDATLAAHIDAWQARLRLGYRSLWVPRLFHHAPLENAVSIIASRQLQSRNTAVNGIGRDIAPAEIIQANNIAHDYARL
jgi:hypothetical protein